MKTWGQRSNNGRRHLSDLQRGRQEETAVRVGVTLWRPRDALGRPSVLNVGVGKGSLPVTQGSRARLRPGITQIGDFREPGGGDAGGGPVETAAGAGGGVVTWSIGGSPDTSWRRTMERTARVQCTKRFSIAPQAVNDLIIHNFYLVGIILFTLHSKYRHPL